MTHKERVADKIETKAYSERSVSRSGHKTLVGPSPGNRRDAVRPWHVSAILRFVCALPFPNGAEPGARSNLTMKALSRARKKKGRPVGTAQPGICHVACDGMMNRKPAKKSKAEVACVVQLPSWLTFDVRRKRHFRPVRKPKYANKPACFLAAFSSLELEQASGSRPGSREKDASTWDRMTMLGFIVVRPEGKLHEQG